MTKVPLGGVCLIHQRFKLTATEAIHHRPICLGPHASDPVGYTAASTPEDLRAVFVIHIEFVATTAGGAGDPAMVACDAPLRATRP